MADQPHTNIIFYDVIVGANALFAFTRPEQIVIWKEDGEEKKNNAFANKLCSIQRLDACPRASPMLYHPPSPYGWQWSATKSSDEKKLRCANRTWYIRGGGDVWCSVDMTRGLLG